MECACARPLILAPRSLLKPMYDDLSLAADVVLFQKVSHVRPLVALQLDNGTQCLIINDGSIGVASFLECLENLPQIQVIGQALNRYDTLTTITLLDANMHKRLLHLLRDNTVVLHI